MNLPDLTEEFAMQPYLFGEESQRLRLSQLGDSLEKLNVVDLEIFRPILMKGLCKERKSSAVVLPTT